MKVKLFNNKKKRIKKSQRAVVVQQMMKAKEQGRAFLTTEGEELLKRWKS